MHRHSCIGNIDIFFHLFYMYIIVLCLIKVVVDTYTTYFNVKKLYIFPAVCWWVSDVSHNKHLLVFLNRIIEFFCITETYIFYWKCEPNFKTT